MSGAEFISLATLALVLGLRHGMDADHLATIDGFVRNNALQRPRLARWGGFLFSFGHGSVVIGAAAVAASMAQALQLPTWLETLGGIVSVAFLLALGWLNLRQAMGLASHAAGLRARLAPQCGGTAAIFFTGALFAFSFDTLSQALFFSVAGKSAWLPPILGGLFMLGMMTSDTLNGLWTAWLMHRAGRAADRAGRVMAWVVGLLSLGVAALGIFRLTQPGFAVHSESLGIWLGFCVVLTMMIGYGIAMWVALRSERRA